MKATVVFSFLLLVGSTVADLTNEKDEATNEIEASRGNTTKFIDDADARVTVLEEAISHTNDIYVEVGIEIVNNSFVYLTSIEDTLEGIADTEGNSAAALCISKRFNKTVDDLNSHLNTFNSDVQSELGKTAAAVETARTKTNAQRLAVDIMFNQDLNTLSTCEDVLCAESARNDALTQSENSRRTLSDTITGVENSRTTYISAVASKYSTLQSFVSSNQDKTVKDMNACL